MKAKEMVKIAGWILQVVNYFKDQNLANDKTTIEWLGKDKFLAGLRARVKVFAKKFPLPGI